MSIANLLSVEVKPWCNLDINDLHVRGNEIVDGTLTASGGIIGGGNITVQNSNPQIAILNNAINVNRASLILNGRTSSNNNTAIQQDQNGNTIIEDFNNNSDISLRANGSGNINLTPVGTGQVNIINANPKLFIKNNAANINSAILTLNGNSANSDSNIYQDFSGNTKIDNLNVNKDIILNTLGTGNVVSNNANGYLQLTGANYTTGIDSLLKINSSNQVQLASNLVPFVPVLTFGGVGGSSYAGQVGAYSKLGNIIFFSFEIVLTLKGAATGTAAISGFPFPAIGTSPNSTFSANNNGNITITGALGGIFLNNATEAILVDGGNSGPTITLTDAQFTNTSDISANGFYFTPS